MSGIPEASTAVPHPVGLFGFIGGREVEFIKFGRAGVFGAPVDNLSVLRSAVPAGTPEVLNNLAVRDDIMLVPLSAVQDLARWTWTVTFEDVDYDVSIVKDGRGVIGTSDSRVVWGDEWDGNPKDGWQRLIDLDGLPVTAHKHPISIAQER